jgi:hypothetical protein
MWVLSRPLAARREPKYSPVASSTYCAVKQVGKLESVDYPPNYFFTFSTCLLHAMEETSTISLNSKGGPVFLRLKVTTSCGWLLRYNGHKLLTGAPGLPDSVNLPLGDPSSMDNAQHRVRVAFTNITNEAQPARIELRWTQALEGQIKLVKEEIFGSKAPDTGLEQIPALEGLIFSRLIQYWSDDISGVIAKNS